MVVVGCDTHRGPLFQIVCNIHADEHIILTEGSSDSSKCSVPQPGCSAYYLALHNNTPYGVIKLGIGM
jgi:hypothetical protein